MTSASLAQRESEVAAFNARVFLAVCSFLTGILCTFNIPLVGSFPASELVLGLVATAGVLTVLLNKRAPHALFASPWLWAFLATELISLAGYALSDFYMESTTVDIARGWSRIVFLAIDTVAIAFLFGEDRRNFRILMTGGAMSGIVMLQLGGGAIFGDSWKFGYAWPVTILGILIASQFGVWLTVGVLVVLSGIHYVADFRSLCGICLIIAAFLVVQTFEKRQRVLIISVMAVVAIAGLFVMKSRPASLEASERGARSNVERSSMLTVAWQAFEESPWIGQGSWFSKSDVMVKFMYLRSQMAEEAGVHGYSVDDDEVMAIHSQILVSLAEGGILGGAFFIFYGLCTLWGQWYCLFQRPLDRDSGMYSLTLIGAIWNLLMSPFSGSHRLNIAIALGVILLLLQEKAEPAPEPEAIAEVT